MSSFTLSKRSTSIVVGYPVYCTIVDQHRGLLVVGGGGGPARSGISNGLTVYKLGPSNPSKKNSSVSTNVALTQCSFTLTDAGAVMNLSFEPRKSILAAGVNDRTILYELLSDGSLSFISSTQTIHPVVNPTMPYGVSNTYSQSQDVYQKCSSFTRSGKMLLTGGSDGQRVKVWSIPELHFISSIMPDLSDFEVGEEILDIAINHSKVAVVQTKVIRVWDESKGTITVIRVPPGFAFRLARFISAQGHLLTVLNSLSAPGRTSATGPSARQLILYGPDGQQGSPLNVPLDRPITAIAVAKSSAKDRFPSQFGTQSTTSLVSSGRTSVISSSSSASSGSTAITSDILEVFVSLASSGGQAGVWSLTVHVPTNQVTSFSPLLAPKELHSFAITGLALISPPLTPSSMIGGLMFSVSADGTLVVTRYASTYSSLLGQVWRWGWWLVKGGVQVIIVAMIVQYLINAHHSKERNGGKLVLPSLSSMTTMPNWNGLKETLQHTSDTLVDKLKDIKTWKLSNTVQRKLSTSSLQSTSHDTDQEGQRKDFEGLSSENRIKVLKNAFNRWYMAAKNRLSKHQQKLFPEDSGEIAPPPSASDYEEDENIAKVDDQWNQKAQINLELKEENNNQTGKGESKEGEGTGESQKSSSYSSMTPEKESKRDADSALHPSFHAPVEQAPMDRQDSARDPLQEMDVPQPPLSKDTQLLQSHQHANRNKTFEHDPAIDVPTNELPKGSDDLGLSSPSAASAGAPGENMAKQQDQEKFERKSEQVVQPNAKPTDHVLHERHQPHHLDAEGMKIPEPETKHRGQHAADPSSAAYRKEESLPLDVPAQFNATPSEVMPPIEDNKVVPDKPPIDTNVTIDKLLTDPELSIGDADRELDTSPPLPSKHNTTSPIPPRRHSRQRQRNRQFVDFYSTDSEKLDTSRRPKGKQRTSKKTIDPAPEGQQQQKSSPSHSLPPSKQSPIPPAQQQHSPELSSMSNNPPAAQHSSVNAHSPSVRSAPAVSEDETDDYSDDQSDDADDQEFEKDNRHHQHWQHRRHKERQQEIEDL